MQQMMLPTVTAVAAVLIAAAFMGGLVGISLALIFDANIPVFQPEYTTILYHI
jgi:hypothetical protein